MNDIERIKGMMQLQDKMNSVVNPAWKDAGYRWQDALMVEAVEAFDHTNWKWWKNTNAEPDWNQIRLEIVDLWHFLLSICLEEDMTADELLEDITFTHNDVTPAKDVGYLRDVFRELVSDSINGNMFEVAVGLGQATFGSGMSIKDVYRLYISKNVLNIFRQQNGYKTGEYFKDWSTEGSAAVEDNQVLSLITNEVKDEDLNAEYLFSRLTEEYAKVKAYRATNRS